MNGIKLDPKALLGLRLIDDNSSTISSKIGKDPQTPVLASKVGKDPQTPLLASKVGKGAR